MKRLLLLLILTPWWSSAQTINHLFNYPIPTDTANIVSLPLSSDSLSSSFLIVIKQNVKSHKHENHTENIYILDGNGTMRLGEKEFDIKQGDHVFIPKNMFHSVRVLSSSPLKVLSIQSPYFDGKDRIWEQP